VHYDKSGRSKGTAHVVYVSAPDALKAYQKFHNVCLDGKRLSIELVETQVPPGTIAKLSSGIK
jgi:THO complex subunit 4